MLARVGRLELRREGASLPPVLSMRWLSLSKLVASAIDNARRAVHSAAR